MQLAVICHECAHLLLDHPSLAVDDFLNGSELPFADQELEAEALGAALVQLSQQPERLRSLANGDEPGVAIPAAAEFRLKFGEYYGPPDKYPSRAPCELCSGSHLRARDV